MRVRRGVLSRSVRAVIDLGVVAFVAVLTSNVPGLGCGLRAFGKGSVRITAREMGRLVLVLLLDLFIAMLVAVLATLVPSLRGSVRAFGEGTIRIATRKMRGLIRLVVRAIRSLGHVVIVLVTLLATLVSSFSSRFRALGESSVGVATRKVRRFVALFLLGRVGFIMLVTGLATLVTRLCSRFRAFGERAIWVGTRRMRGKLVVRTIDALGRIVVVVVLVTVHPAFVTCLDSSDGAFGESAIGVAAVAFEVFLRGFFGDGAGLEGK
jgi:hypothetical protein